MTIWKINISMFLRLSILPRWRKRPQTAMCFSEWLGKLKCRATGLGASLSSEMFTETFTQLLPVSPMYIFKHKMQVMQKVRSAEIHVK